MEFSYLHISISTDQSSEPIRQILAPVTFVNAAIFPKLFTSSISLIISPLSFVYIFGFNRKINYLKTIQVTYIRLLRHRINPFNIGMSQGLLVFSWLLNSNNQACVQVWLLLDRVWGSLCSCSFWRWVQRLPSFFQFVCFSRSQFFYCSIRHDWVLRGLYLYCHRFGSWSHL